MQAFLTVIAVALAIFAWVCIVKIIPDCARSLFRYRLWRLRDELVDEIRAGTFENDEMPKVLAAVVEGTITVAPEATLARMLMAAWTCRSMQVPELFDFESLGRGDRRLLEKRFSEYRQIAVRHILLGAPSGWILTALVGVLVVPVAALFALMMTLSGRRHDKHDGSSWFQDLRHRLQGEVDPALALLGKRGAQSAQSLTQSV